MIRLCDAADFEEMYAIINDAAQAYRGVIPPDRWHEPYMSRSELEREIAAGVVFHGYLDLGDLTGIMGIQDRGDVYLIRHAYVRTSCHRRGIGGRLLRFLQRDAGKPLLVGTWSDAVWAVAFYEKNGFHKVPSQVKDDLLRKYWSIPERQIDTSVVLANAAWHEADG